MNLCSLSNFRGQDIKFVVNSELMPQISTIITSLSIVTVNLWPGVIVGGNMVPRGALHRRNRYERP